MNGQDFLPSISRTSFAKSVFKGRLSGKEACTAIAAIIYTYPDLKKDMLAAGYRFGARENLTPEQRMILCNWLTVNRQVIDLYYCMSLLKKIRKSGKL